MERRCEASMFMPKSVAMRHVYVLAAMACRASASPNLAYGIKTTLAVAERPEALGCDSIEGMARIAMDDNTGLGLRTQMYKELAQYVAPKKPIEVSGEEARPVPIKASRAEL
jgi:hypothetical protein